MITKPQLLTAVAFGIKGVLSNLNKKTGTGVYSIKFFISKTSVKIARIRKKKEFKLAIN